MVNRCGPMSPGDLEEVRRFGAFLRASHGADEDEKRRLYLEHYPECDEEADDRV